MAAATSPARWMAAVAGSRLPCARETARWTRSSRLRNGRPTVKTRIWRTAERIRTLRAFFDRFGQPQPQIVSVS